MCIIAFNDENVPNRCSSSSFPQYGLYVSMRQKSGTTVKKLAKGWKDIVILAKACQSWSIGERAFECRLGFNLLDCGIKMT